MGAKISLICFTSPGKQYPLSLLEIIFLAYNKSPDKTELIKLFEKNSLKIINEKEKLNRMIKIAKEETRL